MLILIGPSASGKTEVAKLLAKKYKNQIDSEKVNLNDVAKSFGIVNPQAHRALADAITTAKVYLELYDLVRMK